MRKMKREGEVRVPMKEMKKGGERASNNKARLRNCLMLPCHVTDFVARIGAH